ncbi:MAG: U3 snoRNP protein [Pycnora praestabilis]|nr:MAG: U3 snoRNP protein [Pycnora praestabilis]
MAAASSGKITKPSTIRKGGTSTTRHHRFRSFSQRIANLNIDPIRRVRRYDLDDGKNEEIISYFKTSLDALVDINLSENFTNFSRQVRPLSESLPQILHFEDRIMDLLMKNIGKRDAQSLEPLLGLLAHFAHDLGTRFEKHFAQAVELVASIAAKHSDVEVIEWCFNCLAWLFKYLSRLLVPDLRPLYNLMAPLLGNEKQKPFVTKFAAEAMSFLVRKAGIVYHKETSPLDTIVRHVFEDLENNGRHRDTKAYQEGLRIMFAGAIKGVTRRIHTGGDAIFRCLLENSTRGIHNQRHLVVEVTCGVLVSLVHHTQAETFSTILTVVLEHVDRSISNATEASLRLGGQLVLIVAGVRKGSRILDWQSLLTAMARLLSTFVDVVEKATEDATPLLFAAATVLQTAPMDAIIPKLRSMMGSITHDCFTSYFLPFSEYFAEVGPERFRNIMLPYFQKFIVSHWDSCEDKLCVSISKLSTSGCLEKTGSSEEKILCPPAWQDRIVDSLELASIGGANDEALQKVARRHGYLNLTASLAFDRANLGRLSDAILDRLRICLQGRSEQDDAGTLLTVGQGFKYYVKRMRDNEQSDASLWPLLYSSASRHGAMPSFLEALLDYLETCSKNLNFESDTVDPLVIVLTNNLGAPSHTLRSLSLRILNELYLLTHSERAEILSTASLIEDTTLTLQSARSVSMHVRKLATSYASAASHPWLKESIPAFCYGLLTVNFAQLWDDATSALKVMSETQKGEDIVANLAFQRLVQVSGAAPIRPSSYGHETQKSGLTDFECSNLKKLDELAKWTLSEAHSAVETLKEGCRRESLSVQVLGQIARSQALRVLTAIPHIAEKRSRQLVPMFLQCANHDNDENVDSDNLAQENTSGAAGGKWSRKDQKAMLGILGKFNNPRVLYKASEVYDSLVNLLANGDAEIQKFSLEAIFTWKSSSINAYRENLINILDDARFREEIAVFMQADNDDNTLQEGHRQALMPVLLRLLYGKVVTREGSASGRRGQQAKRKAVLEALARFSKVELGSFIDIALGPLSDFRIVHEGFLRQDLWDVKLLSVRKQVGLIKMIEDMVEVLGTQLRFFIRNLLEAALYCLFKASRELSKANSEGEEVSTMGMQLSMLRTIRQIGLRCLYLLFNSCPTFEWEPYMPVIIRELVEPRLAKLPIETAESVSGILRIFSSWSSHLETIFFLNQYNNTILGKLSECLEIPAAKDEVKLFILENIIKNIIKVASSQLDPAEESMFEIDRKRIATNLLQPNMDNFLVPIGNLLRKSPSKELLRSCVEAVCQLAPFVSGSSEARSLVAVCVFLLDQPSHRVNPKIKGDLLRILQYFIPLYNVEDDEELQASAFHTVSSLFGYFKDSSSRSVLSEVLALFAQKDSELVVVAELIMEINSFSSVTLDEPDFDRRLKAFNTINEDEYRSFSDKQWRPIVYNMLFYVNDQEELAIRSNASLALRRFIDSASGKSVKESKPSDLIVSVLLPSLRTGARQVSELVRAEYVAVIAHLVKRFPNWVDISDMQVLLVGDNEEEASFFNNILHIQQHRRLRALRRLADDTKQGHLRSGNLSHFFLPLIEHFIFNRAEDDSAHNLAAVTVETIGVIAEWLEWPQYRAMFRRFSGYMSSKPDIEKTVIKLLGCTIDALERATEVKDEGGSSTENAAEGHRTTGTTNIKLGNIFSRCTLAATMPKQEKFSDDLLINLLPPLTKYLHNKDESEVSLRVPVAVSIVKLLRLLPYEQLADLLPPVLTDVSHILRSRDQGSRDTTRKTLAEISTLIGPQCFGFVLKELRGALARGYQLHVLSYTVHSILVATASEFKPGDLDYCLPQIVNIIMDDIFGVTGQEKDAEEYISKMREVKSSKSNDSMQLITQVTTLGHLADLIRPIRDLLHERLDLRTVKKVDELLRRIGLGLVNNDAVRSRDLLVFCYELIKETYTTDIQSTTANSRENHKTKRYIINLKGAKNENRGSTTAYTYKIARFSFDILRSILHKHNALQTPTNLAGFIPIIGDALVQSQEEVRISALRLLTTIIKVPLPEIDLNASLYISEAVKTIEASPSTNTELAQAALKLISAVLRERHDFTPRKTDLPYLLQKVKPDLLEPDRQGVTFNFLKAVLARKVVIAEVYEVLDTVGEMMITNQSREARDLARGVYFQFLMEYPQVKDRLSKQLNFLVQNLTYRHQEGRQSVLEVIHLLLSKVGDAMIPEIVNTFFAPLVLVLINDESPECREMTGTLLKELFQRADHERTRIFISTLRKWLNQDQQTLLARAALQCYGIYFDVHGERGEKELPYLGTHLLQVLQNETENVDEADWELLYFALQMILKLSQLFPSAVLSKNSGPLWIGVQSCLSFPHAWVKLTAAKLIGLYFADFGRANVEGGLQSMPLLGSQGLQVRADEMLRLTRASVGLLRVPGVSEELAMQSIRNLVFLGRCFGANSLRWKPRNTTECLSDGGEDLKEELDVDSEPSKDKTAIQYLFERLSAILRCETLTTRAPSLIPKTAALQLIETLCSHLSLATLASCLQTILLPLHNLTDPSIAAPYSTDAAFTTAYKSLVSTSQGIMALLQKKLGTTDFVMQLAKVRAGVKERREGRRIKRRVEAVAEPEKVGKEKKRKGEKKREKRKERSGEERSRRRGW